MTESSRSQAVLAPPARSAIFLVLTVREGGDNAVRDALGDVAGYTRAVGYREPELGLTCVAGIGRALWDRLFGSPRPAGLHVLPEIAGGTHSAVSTPGDLLLHLRAARLDVCFELARQLVGRFGDAVEVVDEVHGFRNFDERDLLGFVDGTENPQGADAADAVFVGDEDARFAGGSYVVVQKYLHDLDAWDRLPVEEQELAIGRRKLSDIELPDDRKPPNSHLALNVINDDDGEQLQIVRDNMPFGSIKNGEWGTYFIGYAADPGIVERMLRNMFGVTTPGVHDRILDFSTAHTGCLFYVPSADFLDDPPSPPAASQGSAAPGKPRTGCTS